MIAAGTRLPVRERGSASVEMALIVPVLIMVAAMMIAGWRVWHARTVVSSAAESAARAASLAGSAPVARLAARSAGESTMTTLGVSCRPLQVSSDVSGFATRPGTTADVSAEVTCTVSMADLLVPGLPGQITVTASARERLDTYAERGS